MKRVFAFVGGQTAGAKEGKHVTTASKISETDG